MRKQVDSVAVVIPSYNHARFLPDALDSILAQTIPVTEIIVVDDGSHDNPAEVVSHYASVTLLLQTNLGLSAARNTGAAFAQARFIIFQQEFDREIRKIIAEKREKRPERFAEDKPERPLPPRR